MIILGIILSIIPLAILGAFLWVVWFFIRPLLKFAFIGLMFIFVVALIFSS